MALILKRLYLLIGLTLVLLNKILRDEPITLDTLITGVIMMFLWLPVIIASLILKYF